MGTKDPQPVVSRADTDRDMLTRLRREFAGSAEAGWKRNFLDAAVARFSELLEHQQTYEHLVQALVTANNAMLEHLLFSKSALQLLAEQMKLNQAVVATNGHTKAIENLEQKHNEQKGA
jgi:hypothetical protein